MNRYALLLLFFALATSFVSAYGDDVVFNERPQNLQLFTRDATDSATVRFRGTVVSAGYTAIECRVFKDGVECANHTAPLNTSEGGADFELAPRIHAGMHDYSFVIALKSETAHLPILSVEKVVCGDAYILTGQSNSHYVWSDATYQNTFCRTFGVKTGMSNYMAYAPGDTLWSLSQGSSSLGPNVGVLGLYIQKEILEKTGIPTCLINGGTGGSTIDEHLPNSADPLDLNTIYGKTLYRVRKAGLEHIRAVIWHQGESDCNPQAIAAYAGHFSTLVENWSADFGAEKIYLFQIRPGTGGEQQSLFRDLQRRLPVLLNRDNIVVQSTTNLPGHDGLHYSHLGYRRMAEWVTALIRADFYGSADTVDIHPPDIERAVYHPATQAVHLFFKQAENLVWPADTLGQRLEDSFYFDGDFGLVHSGFAAGDSAVLQLTGPHFFDHLTYLPDRFVNNSFDVYQGPWLHNSRGIGALSFYRVAIENPATTVRLLTPNGGERFKPGEKIAIDWNAAGIERVKIEYQSERDQEWLLIADQVPADSGRYVWIVPVISSLECRIRISDQQNPLIADESNTPFAILVKTLTVVSPNGGEKWPVGSSQIISWNSQFVENTVQIQASYDGGTTWSIVKRMAKAADGQIEWVVPDRISENCLIKIFDMREVEVFDVSDALFSIVIASAIDPVNGAFPGRFVLHQNHPNPFNPVTRIDFELPRSGFVRLSLFDLCGRQLATVVEEWLPGGEHRVPIDAAALCLGSGVIFYRLETEGYRETKKMVLVK
ncbi:hypothetical protein JW992_10340 [candidate division KSB1 bacterium]|nr:hypothetical protein [candidate division KSB1 bacterium]